MARAEGDGGGAQLCVSIREMECVCVDRGKEKAGMSGRERGGSYSRKLTAAG